MLLPVALAVPTAAPAATWSVLPDGTGDVATIQTAIDLAAPGDTVALGVGTFTGFNNHRLRVNKAITLRCQNESRSDGAQCIIDCESQGRGMTISAPAVIEGITIRNGLSLSMPGDPWFFGGGMEIFDDPIIRNCIIEDCQGEDTFIWGQGAGVDINGGSPVFEDCVFRNNSFVNESGDGAGIHIYAGSVQLTRCSLTGNTAVHGGGIAAYESSLTLIDCEIAGNLAVIGGGVYAGTLGFPESNPGWVSIQGTRFSGNARSTVSGARGGGLMVDQDVTGEVISCTFAGNRGWFGGGIETHDAITVDRTVLWGNCAIGVGEGASVYVGSTGSVDFTCSDVDPAEVEGPGAVTFDANSVSVDPLFCDAKSCTVAPTAAGIYDVDQTSVVLNLPGCGPIGAGGAACAVVGVEATARPPERALTVSPNPLDSTTELRFSLDSPARVTLVIHDVTGRKVRLLSEGQRGTGTHRVIWDGTDDAGTRLASGVYFASVSVDDRRTQRRIVLRR